MFYDLIKLFLMDALSAHLQWNVRLSKGSKINSIWYSMYQKQYVNVIVLVRRKFCNEVLNRLTRVRCT